MGCVAVCATPRSSGVAPRRAARACVLRVYASLIRACAGAAESLHIHIHIRHLYVRGGASHSTATVGTYLSLNGPGYALNKNGRVTSASSSSLQRQRGYADALRMPSLNCAVGLHVEYTRITRGAKKKIIRYYTHM